MESLLKGPLIGVVGYGAPFRWLGGAWSDLGRAFWPCLIYGLVVAALSFGLCYALVRYDAAFWVLALTCGFVFVAPMLAMGLYEAGRRLEAGERPTLEQMVFVHGAFRQDVAYLGLLLTLIYLLWSRIAQVVYGLSTYRLHRTVAEFATFAFATPEGRSMLAVGGVVGGIIAFFTYSLVIVSAPMLLDQRSNVFSAVFTSVRVMAANFGPLLLWALVIVVLLLLSALTGFWALTIVFPWLGLASWRAYREMVTV